MNLDDTSTFKQIDPQDMLSQIDGLPDQLQAAWELGSSKAVPAWPGVRQVVVAGMGGSAIGADLLAAYVAPFCPVPVYVHRDYTLPAWASGQETVVIAASHSGNTEETIAAFEQALARNCHCLAIATGGKLADAAYASATPLWVFEHDGQPRAAVGFSFGLLLAALTRMNLLPDPASVAAEVEEAIAAMRRQQETLRAEIPAVKNPAKRMAGQLMDRWVAVIASDILSPVARRWKGQISELAKAWAQFEFLPEADHNTLAGSLNPEEKLAYLMVLFLRAPSDHPRNRLRSDLTRKSFMLQGLSTDFIDARGDTRLAHQWTALHFGDYTAYYLAMAYGVDPTPVEALESFKRELMTA